MGPGLQPTPLARCIVPAPAPRPGQQRHQGYRAGGRLTFRARSAPLSSSSSSTPVAAAEPGARECTRAAASLSPSRRRRRRCALRASLRPLAPGIPSGPRIDKGRDAEARERTGRRAEECCWGRTWDLRGRGREEVGSRGRLGSFGRISRARGSVKRERSVRGKRPRSRMVDPGTQAPGGVKASREAGTCGGNREGRLLCGRHLRFQPQPHYCTQRGWARPPRPPAPAPSRRSRGAGRALSAPPPAGGRGRGALDDPRELGQLR